MNKSEAMAFLAERMKQRALAKPFDVLAAADGITQTGSLAEARKQMESYQDQITFRGLPIRLTFTIDVMPPGSVAQGVRGGKFPHLSMSISNPGSATQVPPDIAEEIATYFFDDMSTVRLMPPGVANFTQFFQLVSVHGT